MKRLLGWLSRAMSENGVPSSKRVVFVVSLLFSAPVLLGAALFRAPGAFPEAFTAWVIGVGGAYAASRFAENRGNKTEPPQG